jgi:hypothetical protein
MALSITDICNMSLEKVGTSLIEHYETDSTGNAVKCRRYYPQVRDEVLRSFSWNFASTRIKLSSAWLTATVYMTDQYVWTSALLYKCAIAHTSGTFATDLATGKWTLVTARPSSGYAYAYDLPDDCLRVITPVDKDTDEPLDSESYPWRIEDRQILFNETDCDIRYVYRNVIVSEYDPLFVQVLVYMLAVELSMAIKQSEKLPAEIIQYLQTVLIPQARSLDAQESSTKILSGKTLMRSRLISRLS